MSQPAGRMKEYLMKGVEMNLTQRAEQWLETTPGYYLENGNVAAHREQKHLPIRPKRLTRNIRERIEKETLSEGATISEGGGNRKLSEEPDLFRTSFERDRDRILHSAAFRRLAGKTQVFIFPSDHQRTRLTHALEVAQVASAISRGIGLNLALTEAIALGHDCGHGPGGHASEDAFSVFLAQGYDHASWGADHTLSKLNLCIETLDGIRNHSWSRPQPMTPEGIVVSFADRIAYCAHDLEDAVGAGIVDPSHIPSEISAPAGISRASQLRYFITNMISTISETGEIALSSQAGQVLSALRKFNYQNIYMREESVNQSKAVIDVLGKLVEFYASNPEDIHNLSPDTTTDDLWDPYLAAVNYVSGMTDKFAFQKATEVLGYHSKKLPVGIDFSPNN